MSAPLTGTITADSLRQQGVLSSGYSPDFENQFVTGLKNSLAATLADKAISKLFQKAKPEKKQKFLNALTDFYIDSTDFNEGQRERLRELAKSQLLQQQPVPFDFGKELQDFGGAFANEATYNLTDFPQRDSLASFAGGTTAGIGKSIGSSLLGGGIGALLGPGGIVGGALAGPAIDDFLSGYAQRADEIQDQNLQFDPMDSRAITRGALYAAPNIIPGIGNVSADIMKQIARTRAAKPAVRAVEDAALQFLPGMIRKPIQARIQKTGPSISELKRQLGRETVLDPLRRGALTGAAAGGAVAAEQAIYDDEIQADQVLMQALTGGATGAAFGLGFRKKTLADAKKSFKDTTREALKDKKLARDLERQEKKAEIVKRQKEGRVAVIERIATGNTKFARNFTNDAFEKLLKSGKFTPKNFTGYKEALSEMTNNITQQLLTKLKAKNLLATDDKRAAEDIKKAIKARVAELGSKKIDGESLQDAFITKTRKQKIADAIDAAVQKGKAKNETELEKLKNRLEATAAIENAKTQGKSERADIAIKQKEELVKLQKESQGNTLKAKKAALDLTVKAAEIKAKLDEKKLTLKERVAKAEELKQLAKTAGLQARAIMAADKESRKTTIQKINQLFNSMQKGALTKKEFIELKQQVLSDIAQTVKELDAPEPTPKAKTQLVELEASTAKSRSVTEEDKRVKKLDELGDEAFGQLTPEQVTDLTRFEMGASDGKEVKFTYKARRTGDTSDVGKKQITVLGFSYNPKTGIVKVHGYNKYEPEEIREYILNANKKGSKDSFIDNVEITDEPAYKGPLHSVYSKGHVIDEQSLAQRERENMLSKANIEAGRITDESIRRLKANLGQGENIQIPKEIGLGEPEAVEKKLLQNFNNEEMKQLMVDINKFDEFEGNPCA